MCYSYPGVRSSCVTPQLPLSANRAKAHWAPPRHLVLGNGAEIWPDPAFHAFAAGLRGQFRLARNSAGTAANAAVSRFGVASPGS
jgi:hypothetical protein